MSDWVDGRPRKVLRVPNLEAPAVVRELHLRRCQVNPTNGNGACSVHSVFGEEHRGTFFKANARHFLREKFGADAETFSARVRDLATLNELGHTLWQELV